jgi:drug/metabolite transporter (DMT)-like permease
VSSVVVRYLFINYALDPLALTAVRTAIASATMIGLLNLRGRQLPAAMWSWKDIITIAGVGLLTLGVSHGTFALAIYTVGVSIATLLNYTAPAFVVVAARILFGESIGLAKTVALAACGIGIILITEPWQASGHSLPWLGILFGVISGVAYAGFTISAKGLGPRFGSDRMIAFGLAFASLELAALSLQRLPDLLRQIDRLWYWLIFLGVVQTLGGWILYTAGLKRIQASVASLLATLEPVAAISVSALVLGEALNPVQLAGALAILAGAIVTSRAS